MHSRDGALERESFFLSCKCDRSLDGIDGRQWIENVPEKIARDWKAGTDAEGWGSNLPDETVFLTVKGFSWWKRASSLEYWAVAAESE